MSTRGRRNSGEWKLQKTWCCQLRKQTHGWCWARSHLHQKRSPSIPAQVRRTWALGLCMDALGDNQYLESATKQPSPTNNIGLELHRSTYRLPEICLLGKKYHLQSYTPHLHRHKIHPLPRRFLFPWNNLLTVFNENPYLDIYMPSYCYVTSESRLPSPIFRHSLGLLLVKWMVHVSKCNNTFWEFIWVPKKIEKIIVTTYRAWPGIEPGTSSKHHKGP